MFSKHRQVYAKNHNNYESEFDFEYRIGRLSRKLGWQIVTNQIDALKVHTTLNIFWQISTLHA